MQRSLAHRHRIIAPASRVRGARPAPRRDFRARGMLTLVETRVEQAAMGGDACVLCEGSIDRFYRGIWVVTGRCAACEDTLA